MPKVTVRHMRSYDYSQFDVSLTYDEEINYDGVRELQQQVLTLVDEMVERFKINRGVERDREHAEWLAKEGERKRRFAEECATLPPDPFQNERLDQDQLRRRHEETQEMVPEVEDDD